jgi:hypothetical protein
MAMEWVTLLKQGPGEPPGRAEAIERAKAKTAARYKGAGPKRAKGSSKTKVTKVSRSQLRKSD